MSTFVFILALLCALGALFFLIRGIVTFLQTTEAELKSGATGPSQSSLKQNKMMFGRVGFQAAAVLLCVLFMALSR